MKSPGLLESHRLEILLEYALHTEGTKWKVPCFLDSMIKGTDISSIQYKQTVQWMQELKSCFQFYLETFGLAVSILNRILASVKAQVKYLRCIAVTCLYLAAKTNEEDEIIPSVKKLAVQSGCMYSPAEILRMERLILDKLHWDLYMATPIDFLNTFHAMVMSNWPHLFGGFSQMNPSLHVALLMRQLQHCMACHQLLQFSGSTLALAIITLELERMSADWFPVVTDLLKKAKIDSANFRCCKELVDQHLEIPSNPVYIFMSASKDIHPYVEEQASSGVPTASYTPLLTSVPMTESHLIPEALSSNINNIELCGQNVMETDEFYDGFQHLYNEDNMQDQRKINEALISKKPQTLLDCSNPCPPPLYSLCLQ